MIKHKQLPKRNKVKDPSSKRTSILTPAEGAGATKKRRQRKTRYLKGHAAVLRTGSNGYEVKLS